MVQFFYGGYFKLDDGGNVHGWQRAYRGRRNDWYYRNCRTHGYRHVLVWYTDKPGLRARGIRRNGKSRGRYYIWTCILDCRRMVQPIPVF